MWTLSLPPGNARLDTASAVAYTLAMPDAEPTPAPTATLQRLLASDFGRLHPELARRIAQQSAPPITPPDKELADGS